MKRIHLLLLLVVCCLPVTAQFTREKLNEAFGEIRADMVRFACDIAGFNVENVLDRIQNNQIYGFVSALENQGEEAAILSRIVRNANWAMRPGLQGTDINIYQERIILFKKRLIYELLSAYPNRSEDINRQKEIFERQINNLSERLIAQSRVIEANDAVVQAEKSGNEEDINEARNRAEQAKRDLEQAREREAALTTALEEAEAKAGTMRTVAILIAVLAVLIIIGFIVFKNKKNQKIVVKNENTPNPVVPQPKKETVTATQPQPVVTTLEEPKPKQPPRDCVVLPPEPTPVSPVTVTPPTSPKTPISTSPLVFATDADEWIIVGASVIGNGHISQNLPCQDSHKYEYLGDGWGIAVTSDGAGSAQNSHIGSKIVAERSVFHFKDLIIRRNWIKSNELPTEAEWLLIATDTLKKVRNEMAAFAKQKDIELKSLYATAIVLIHTPNGILATHIGDGRAGYKNEKGEWKALITPHKGEEANQTIFLPSDFWDIPAYKMSGVLVPESVVITEQPFAFALMTDGCENTAWLCNQKDDQTGKFIDPNKPFAKFFDSLNETLQSFRSNKVEDKERAEKWGNFIASGNDSLKREQDDKTMILGVIYQ